MEKTLRPHGLLWSPEKQSKIFMAAFALVFLSAIIYLAIQPTQELAIDANSTQEPNEEEPEIIAIPECPYECCNQNPEYRQKICTANRSCVNNKCELQECTFQCCAGRTGYEDKACPNEQECIGGKCIKPECPGRCCMANDPDYQEKACPTHLRCVGRVCINPI
ncbi:MAG: hypothetical protein NUV67_01120 [archaeon]|nr:hypothetical protein [archaeon]